METGKARVKSLVQHNDPDGDAYWFIVIAMIR
jgi:hypothetical protein